jgi:hypothetical protein
MSEDVTKKKWGGPQANSGRKPLALELKIPAKAIKAIVEVYGSEDNYWRMLAEKSVDSLPHLAMLHSYAYGKPIENKTVDHKGLPQIKAIIIANGTDDSIQQDNSYEETGEEDTRGDGSVEDVLYSTVLDNPGDA